MKPRREAAKPPSPPADLGEVSGSVQLAPLPAVVFTPEDEKWMAIALDRGARGTPSPNPHVGAVVVAGGEAVGVGHHERAGDEHAEQMALSEAGARAAGATLYVTLEPCAHVGRTPPCVDAIARAKIARVVVGCPDPNPHVEGGGIAKLRQLGVQVDVGCSEAAARRLIAPWAKFVTTGVPHVVLKLALSLDGRIATRTGASKWVTGPEARARVHLLRAQHDAVLVGVGTSAGRRSAAHRARRPGAQPAPASSSTRGSACRRRRASSRPRARCPPGVVCSTDAPSSAEEALTDRGVEVIRAAPSAEGRVDPLGALKMLASRGIVTVMIEGGAELAGSVLAGCIVDELHLLHRAAPARPAWPARHAV